MKKLLTIIAVLIITVNGFSQVIRPAQIGYFSSFNMTGSTLGDILYHNGTSFAKLGIGSAGQVLYVSGGLPSWQNVGGVSPWYQVNFPNDTWSVGLDVLGNQRNFSKINTNNVIEFAGDVAIGAFYTVADAGALVLWNQAIINSAYGTVHSGDFQIDDVSVLKIRSESDGGGASVANSTYVIAKDLYVTDFHTDQATVTGDTEFTSVVPAKFLLKYLIAEETAGNAATLDLGTTAGASDVFLNQVFAASTITTVVINKVFSFSAVQSLFLNDDDGSSSWNSGSLNVYFVIERISE